MTIDDAINGISDNLSFVFTKLSEIEESENLSTNDTVTLYKTKEMIVGFSNLILSIADNRESLNDDYIVYEIKIAQKFCKKSMVEINKIDKKTKLF